MTDAAKALRAKLCIDSECVHDAGCGCLDAIHAALTAAQGEAISIDAQRRAEIADICKANALLHALWDAEIARLRKANALLHKLAKNRDAEIARLRAENERLHGLVEAIGDEERENDGRAG